MKQMGGGWYTFLGMVESLDRIKIVYFKEKWNKIYTSEFQKQFSYKLSPMKKPHHK